MADRIPPDKAPASAGSPLADGKATQLETHINSLFTSYQATGLSTHDPYHKVVVSLCALGLVTDRARAEQTAAQRQGREELATLVGQTRQVATQIGKASGEVEEAAEQIAVAEAAVAGTLAKLAAFDRTFEDRADRIERATRLDLNAAVMRNGSLLAGLVVASLLVGAVGGYDLGARETFGTPYTAAERLQRTFGLDALSARMWSDLIPLNDPRPLIARCRDLAQYGYQRDRRYCDMQLTVPPAQTPPGT
ncbi:hypothetical protein [Methylobacterium sp. AMS5]|uniref:hypothetical protein n=1 Tax=Methylobacterium sp. AMS5 TaxID=925818 RepID=UPI00074F88BC|nr:hypothetical protein [Methylobacterium sp. AMS5]AMB47676.1 hypothetical protein Y590_22245 [Methylobacterium sp. AMS5]